MRPDRQVSFQALTRAGVVVLREVTAAIFTAPSRTFYGKVQLQAKCQGLVGQPSPGRLPQAEAGATAWSGGV